MSNNDSPISRTASHGLNGTIRDTGKMNPGSSGTVFNANGIVPHPQSTSMQVGNSDMMRRFLSTCYS
jgi:hypothetical protein